MPLDEIDKSLLRLLQQDAGRTLRELGEEAGLSPSAVQRRIGRYRAAGLIDRQVVVLNPAVAGGVLVAIVLVTLEYESIEHHQAFAQRMAEAPEIQQCYAISGEWDYVIVLTATDMPHCHKLSNRLFKADENIKRYDTMFVFESVKAGLEIPL